MATITIELDDDLARHVEESARSEHKSVSDWVKERAQSTKAEGMYVLVCKQPARIDVRAGDAIHQKAFTPSNRVPFAAQSRLEPVPYSCPARMTNGTLSAAYRIAASKIVVCSPLG